MPGLASRALSHGTAAWSKSLNPEARGIMHEVRRGIATAEGQGASGVSRRALSKC
jgi:hypothetical protein